MYGYNDAVYPRTGWTAINNEYVARRFNQVGAKRPEFILIERGRGGGGETGGLKERTLVSGIRRLICPDWQSRVFDIARYIHMYLKIAL